MAVGFGCCKAGSRPSGQGNDAFSTVRHQRCVSGKLDRALVTPTEDAHGSAAEARVTHQRVVLGLWRSDLDAVKLDIGLVVGRVTSKLLRSVLVAIISARK